VQKHLRSTQSMVETCKNKRRKNRFSLFIGVFFQKLFSLKKVFCNFLKTGFRFVESTTADPWPTSRNRSRWARWPCSKHSRTPLVKLAAPGSILWSQFSAIFDNFRRKNWRFSQKPMLWSKFCIIYLCFESKRPIFCRKFRRKYFKNHNIGP
jgi:hypothetical protein